MYAKDHAQETALRMYYSGEKYHGVSWFSSKGMINS